VHHKWGAFNIKIRERQARGDGRVLHNFCVRRESISDETPNFEGGLGRSSSNNFLGLDWEQKVTEVGSTISSLVIPGNFPKGGKKTSEDTIPMRGV